MKKFTFINLLGALCLLCLIIPATARLSGQRYDEDAVVIASTDTATITDGGLEDMAKTRDLFGGDEGAFDYGYNEAEFMWNSPSFDYTCEVVYPDFWEDVKTQVFDLCEDKWMGRWLQDDKTYQCKDGAREFVVEQIGHCATTEDCHQFGIGAAASVAGSFCRREGSWSADAELFPPKCEKHAIMSCQYDVVNLVEKFIQGNGCNNEDSALDSIDELHRLCAEEIEELVNEINSAFEI